MDSKVNHTSDIGLERMRCEMLKPNKVEADRDEAEVAALERVCMSNWRRKRERREKEEKMTT